MKRKARLKSFSARATVCLTALAAGAALAQGSFPAVNGAAIPADRRPAQSPAKLVAPDLRAQVLELPPTVPPLGLARADWGPRQIGYVEALPAGMQPAANWQSIQGIGAVLRLELTSLNAKGLRVQLRGELNGMELRVYQPDGQAVFGPYTYFPGVWAEGEEPSWWTPTIDGESIGLEFSQPKGTPMPLPQLAAISYVYEDVAEDYEVLGGSCILDSTCFPAWATEARAVGRMNFVDGGGDFVCTGAMLNRNPQDFAPIFMTARHCINNQAAANSLEIHWLFQSDTCDGAVPALSTRPRNNGSLLLKQHRDSDWSLLGLFEPSRSDTFLGWDTARWADSSVGTGIHHPGGRPKKIYSGLKTADTTCFTTDHAVESNRQYRFNATQGAARRGSSGSPIFDVDHRVRGTLSCGPGGIPEPLTCPPNESKTYGRFDFAFPIVRWYLSEMAQPVHADSSFVGDPGEDGDRERGTSTNPFTTVYKASFAVRSGGEILLRAGTFSERAQSVTLSRPMTLRAVGGTATITRVGSSGATAQLDDGKK